MRLYAIRKVAATDSGVGEALAGVPPFSLGFAVPAEARVLVASQDGDADGIAVLLPGVWFASGQREAISAIMLHTAPEEAHIVTAEPLTLEGLGLVKAQSTYQLMQVVPGSLIGQPPTAQLALSFDEGPSDELAFSGDRFSGALVAGPTRVFKALHAGEAIGECGVAPTPDGDRLLRGVHVVEDARRKHVGAALVHHCLGQLFDEGVSRVSVLVEETAGGGLKMAKSLGFRAAGTLYAYKGA